MDEVLDHDILQSLQKAGALKEALLSETLTDDRVRCNICQRRCTISQGGVGYCRTKVNLEGVLFCTIYGVVSSAAADPIEKKPVFHYKPGSLCYSVGSLGCNFCCVFCQNWEIAYADSTENRIGGCVAGVTPEKLVELAELESCQGVAWTYNEPAIWLNYTLESAKLCREQGLYTVYVTNGYATPEHLDTIGPYLDVYRVDIKSMDDRFYRDLIQLSSAQGIREVAARARNKWNMHIECVTNIIPGWNDTEDNITRTARWIVSALGEDTPWHITRFFPYGKLSHIPPTPSETLAHAVRTAKKAGLKFVYLGNIASETGENTYCPRCRQLAVQRSRYSTRLVAVDESGNCTSDGEPLNITL